MLLENLILIIEVILINISFLAYGALISYLVKFDVNSLVYKVGFNYIFGIIISALTIFLLSLIINPLIIKSIFFSILVIYFFLILKKIEFELNPNLIFIIFLYFIFDKNNIVHPDALSGHYEIPFKTILNDRFYFDKQNNFYGFYTYAFNYIYIILNKKIYTNFYFKPIY